MAGSQRFILVLILVAVGGSLVTLGRRLRSESTGVATAAQSRSSPGITATSRASPIPTAPADPAGGLSLTRKSFRTLPVLERSAILVEIRHQPLGEIFVLWQQAGDIDRDLMKQGAIATTMAHALREMPPTSELLDETWRYVSDGSRPFEQRSWVLGIFGGAKTVEGIEFLLKAASTLPEPQLRQVAIEQISGMGDLLGDGSYHEERSVPLERAWHDAAAGPDLLARVGTAMARIGAPSGIRSLMAAAFDSGPTSGNRRQAALFALSQAHTRNAVAPLAARLADEKQTTPAAILLSRTLVGIGDAAAAEAVLGWLRTADTRTGDLIPQLVAASRSSIMLQAWEAQLKSTDPRTADIRSAILASLVERKKGTLIQ